MLQECSNPPTNSICSKTPNVQIRKYNAEEAFKLLYSHSHELKLDHLVEIQKQSVPEEVQGRELEPKGRPMTVLKFSEGLSMIETAIKLLRGLME
jgi:hypothetical protein